MHYLRKLLMHSPGHYIAALGTAAVAAVYRYWTLPAGVGVRFAAYEILSVSGMVTVLVGGLMTVAYLGAFDIFGFAFSPGRFEGKRKYKDYVDYTQQKTQKRARDGWYFVPYYLAGAVLLLISAIFSV